MWKSEFRKMRVRIYIIVLIMCILFLLVISLRDWSVQTLSSMELTDERMPKLFNKLMKINMSELAQKLKDDDFYVWSQWFGKNFGQFVPLIALIIAFPLFSREYEKKTIYYLITRIRRNKIYLYKFAIGFLVLCFILLFLSLLPLLSSLILKWNIRYEKFIGYTIQTIIGGVTFYSLFVLLSVIFMDQVKPVILGISIIVGTAFFGISSKLNVLNIYSYIMAKNVFQNISIDITRSIIYILFSIFLFFLDMLIFEMKEL